MINKALRIVRQYHKMKQTDLSAELGISKSYLSEIESGKKAVSYALLEKYSKVFDIETSSLVFFSESLDSKSKFSEKFRVAFAGEILKIMEWVVDRDDKKKKVLPEN